MKIFLIFCASFLLGVGCFVMALLCCALQVRLRILRQNESNKTSPWYYGNSKEWLVQTETDPIFIVLYMFFWPLTLPCFAIHLWYRTNQPIMQKILETMQKFVTHFVPEEPIKITKGGD